MHWNRAVVGGRVIPESVPLPDQCDSWECHCQASVTPEWGGWGELTVQIMEGIRTVCKLYVHIYIYKLLDRLGDSLFLCEVKQFLICIKLNLFCNCETPLSIKIIVMSCDAYAVISCPLSTLRFLTGPANLKDPEAKFRFPRIFVNTEDSYEELHLIVYKVRRGHHSKWYSIPYIVH